MNIPFILGLLAVPALAVVIKVNNKEYEYFKWWGIGILLLGLILWIGLGIRTSVGLFAFYFYIFEFGCSLVGADIGYDTGGIGQAILWAILGPIIVLGILGKMTSDKNGDNEF